MHYDPILCMNIPDKVTAKDAAVNEYEIHYTVPGKRQTMVGSGKGSTEAEAKADFLSYHKSENPNIISVKFYKKVTVKDGLKIVKEDGLWSVYKDGKQVGQSNSESGAIRLYNKFNSEKVSDNVAAKDANKYVEQAIKWMKENKGRMEILFGLEHMGLTPTEASRYFAEANMELGYKYSSRDVKTIDQAIITCDEANYNDIKEVFNLLSQALQSSSDEKKWTTLVGKAQSKLLSMATKAKGF